jgi:murein DD-endopeptidase MepM/ murein hydrolase activator NlpD
MRMHDSKRHHHLLVVMVLVWWCCCSLSCSMVASSDQNSRGLRRRRKMKRRKEQRQRRPGGGGAIVDYWTAFDGMRNDAVWPLPMSATAGHISSTFGLRKRASCDDCNDFHRGVDISGQIGEPVVASYNGTVVVVKVHGASRNKVIVLEHKFGRDHDDDAATPVVVRFQGHKINKWYTQYFHLDEQLVQEGDRVVAGHMIGRVGETGVKSGDNPHLHMEVRLGTRCSLEYARNNPSSTCNELGIDPQVHPLLIFPKTSVGKSFIETSLWIYQRDEKNPGDNHKYIVRVTTPDNCMDVNRYQVVIRNRQNGMIRLSHVLDYNLRIGFDPTSTKALDKVDKTKPYLQPIPFGEKKQENDDDHATWMIELIIPTVWFRFKRADEEFVVIVENIWQRRPRDMLVF